MNVPGEDSPANFSDGGFFCTQVLDGGESRVDMKSGTEEDVPISVPPAALDSEIRGEGDARKQDTT